MPLSFIWRREMTHERPSPETKYTIGADPAEKETSRQEEVERYHKELHEVLDGYRQCLHQDER